MEPFGVAMQEKEIKTMKVNRAVTEQVQVTEYMWVEVQMAKWKEV